MHQQRLYYGQDFQAPGSVFSNVALDTTQNVSVYNHPALVPAISVTPGTPQTGAALKAGTSTPVATLNGGNAFALVDTIMVTSQSGDNFTVTTSGPVVDIALTGILSSGMVHSGATGVVSNAIRNGAIVQVLLDGAVVTTVDLYGVTKTLRYYLSSGSHTFEVLHTGQFDTNVQPIGAVTPLVGTSVSSGLTLAGSTTQRTLVPASWRVLATSAGAYSLYKTPAGGTESLIASALAVGTTYDSSSWVPGAAFRLTGTLTTNDSATFTTDQVMLGVISLTISTGSGGNYGSYTSPVFDTGAQDTHLLLAEFEASDLVQGNVNGVGGYVSPSFTLSVGQTPTADPTWSTITGVLVDQVSTPTGLRQGVYSVGLLSSSRARYYQWTFTFPQGLTTVPWVRNFSLYGWVPERDPQFLSKVPMGLNWSPYPLLEGFYGTFAIAVATARAAVLDFINSYTIGGAVDQYLQAIGADLGVPTYDGESPPAYRVRLQAALASRPEGGSGVFLATQLAELLSAETPTVATAYGGVLQTVTASAPDLVTGPVVLAQTSAWHCTVGVPAAVVGSVGSTVTWPGLPGVAAGQGALGRTIVLALLTILMPLGAIYTVSFAPDGGSS